MCFLYRQSISIVYESKFKYIYRYFIKIDRCFCGILQSLPLRKCGLKFISQRLFPCTICVTSLAEVWIEIQLTRKINSDSFVTSLAEVWIEIRFYKYSPKNTLRHFPCGSVDWNPVQKTNGRGRKRSLPLRKCGLKSDHNIYQSGIHCHFPCGSVDWNHTLEGMAKRWGQSLPLRKCGLK